MEFCKVKPDNYDAMLKIQPIKKLEGLIRDYFIHLREDRKLAQTTVALYTSWIAHFHEMSNVVI